MGGEGWGDASIRARRKIAIKVFPELFFDNVLRHSRRDVRYQISM